MKKTTKDKGMAEEEKQATIEDDDDMVKSRSEMER